MEIFELDTSINFQVWLSGKDYFEQSDKDVISTMNKTQLRKKGSKKKKTCDVRFEL